jgi:hypothetical protein
MIAPTKAPTAVTTPVEANRPEKWKETRRKVRSNFDQWKYCIFSSAGETSWLSKESLTVHEFGGERGKKAGDGSSQFQDRETKQKNLEKQRIPKHKPN